MEIKASNGLTTNDIHTGHYLIVPYYVDAIAILDVKI